MKLTRPSDVRKLLESRGIQPTKSKGQNFLIDGNILRILVDAASLTPDDRVLEIGPGLGVLTGELLQRAAAVCAIEMDDRLYEGLARDFSGNESLTLIHADALDVPLETIRDMHCSKFVSNLPYGAGNRILMNFFIDDVPFERLVVTVQDDVAHRLAADPNTRAYSLLSIWAQLDYRPRIRKIVSPTCFYPPPRIHSAVVVFERRKGRDRRDLKNRKHLGELLKQMFTQRRKQLGTLLRKAPVSLVGKEEWWREALSELHLDPRQRPETVSVDQWVELSNAFQHSTLNLPKG